MIKGVLQSCYTSTELGTASGAGFHSVAVSPMPTECNDKA